MIKGILQRLIECILVPIISVFIIIKILLIPFVGIIAIVWYILSGKNIMNGYMYSISL